MHIDLQQTGLNGKCKLDLYTNCTLEHYAEKTKLPIDFLKSLGCETIRNAGHFNLKIPYYHTDGNLHRNRIRRGLFKSADGGDKRMLWDQRSKGIGICLYGLDQIPAPGNVVYLVEGESDCQTLWFHKFDALGVPGSTQYKPERDDEFLVGRNIIAIIEPDEGGKQLIRQLSKSRHRNRIKLLVLKETTGRRDVNELHCASPEFKSQFEKALHRTVRLEKFLEQFPELDAQAQVTATKLPEGFRYVDGESIEYLSSYSRSKDDSPDEIWEPLCSTMQILAAIRHGSNTAYGTLIRIKTIDGNWHRVSVLNERLVASDDILAALAGLGLRFDPSAKVKAKLKKLLALVEPDRRARSVDRVGWDEDAYVLPDEVIGNNKGEIIYFQPDKPIQHAYSENGSFEVWKTEVAAKAVNNSRLIFVIGCAFAAPLLHLMGMESGGFNIEGQSSKGKITALRVAASVWGGGGINGFIRRWRGTDNAFEKIAKIHCDALLPLDEMGEVDPRTIYKTAYMFANQQGKLRSDAAGHVRPPTEWRVLFLSTGEISLFDKITEDGKQKPRAGQQVRVVDIPMDAGKGLGLFEDLHGANRPEDFADSLRETTSKHYGHASREYLQELTANIEVWKARVRGYMDRFEKDLSPIDADGQVSRVLKRFAIVAAAGEVAIEMGILPWIKDISYVGVKQVANDWLKQRGGPQALEAREAVSQARSFIETNAKSRIANFLEPPPQIRDCAGYLHRQPDATSHFYIFRDVFRKEICNGLNYTLVARELHKRGMLVKQADSYTCTKRLPGFEELQRVYVLTSKILEGSDDDTM